MSAQERNEFEAKVTALLLGELPESEAAEVRAQIARDPELAKWQEQLRLTLDLVRETATTPANEIVAPPVPLKLSAAKREALLARFKTVPMTPSVPAPSAWRKWLVPVAAAAAIAVAATFLFRRQDSTLGFTWGFGRKSELGFAGDADRAPAVAESSATRFLVTGSNQSQRNVVVVQGASSVSKEPESVIISSGRTAATISDSPQLAANKPVLGDLALLPGVGNRRAPAVAPAPPSANKVEVYTGQNAGAERELVENGAAAASTADKSDLNTPHFYTRYADVTNPQEAPQALFASATNQAVAESPTVNALEERMKLAEAQQTQEPSNLIADDLLTSHQLDLMTPHQLGSATEPKGGVYSINAVGYINVDLASNLLGSSKLYATNSPDVALTQSDKLPAQHSAVSAQSDFALADDSMALDKRTKTAPEVQKQSLGVTTERPPQIIQAIPPIQNQVDAPRNNSDDLASTGNLRPGGRRNGRGGFGGGGAAGGGGGFGGGGNQFQFFGGRGGKIAGASDQSIPAADSGTASASAAPVPAAPAVNSKELADEGLAPVTLASPSVSLPLNAVPSENPGAGTRSRFFGAQGRGKATRSDDVPNSAAEEAAQLATLSRDIASASPAKPTSSGSVLRNSWDTAGKDDEIKLSVAAPVNAPQVGGVVASTAVPGPTAGENSSKELAQLASAAHGLAQDQNRVETKSVDSSKFAMATNSPALPSGTMANFALLDEKSLEHRALQAAAVPPALAPSVEAKKDAPLPQPSAATPTPQPEILAASNAFSTFSLNVSDVSFRLAGAALDNGALPEAASIRSEEFINAFDYRDPAPPAGTPIAFAYDRAGDPFAHHRDLLRFSLKTAAQGRADGRPLNIVLLLDKSGSMERADRVATVREALQILAAQLRPGDTVSVVLFARTARLWADGLNAAEFTAREGELESITPEGGTNLEEAMKLAYATALKHYQAGGENRVVVLTDGAANLGDVDPDALKKDVAANRIQGIAFDTFGVGREDLNDTLLETLSRAGGGRYGFINTPEEADTEFAGQLAGALRVAASDVKVQVEFNPQRVVSWRQIGYAKDKLTKEQFRDNTVKAAQLTFQEAGNALYTVELNAQGTGPICTVRMRYRVPGTEDYREESRLVPYTGSVAGLDAADPAMRLIGTAAAFSEWLATSPYAGEVSLDQLTQLMNGVPQAFGADHRPQHLLTMIQEARSLSGNRPSK